MKLPKINVLITVFNAEKYIKKCIQSLIDQSYKNWEAIIIDDKSTDKSIKIIKNNFRDKRIKITKLKKNIGRAKAMNLGISKCKADYVAILDADDIAAPERFKKQIKTFNNKKHIKLLASWCNIIDENNNEIGPYRPPTKTNLEMKKGQAWSNVADQGAGGEVTITTPTAVASVKGTVFDLEFDEDNGESILTVMSGEVSFANELGELIAGAMEAASASKDSGPSKRKISSKDLPSWQKNTDPALAFKLKPDILAKQQTGKIIKVGIQVLNAKSKAFKNSFSGTVAVDSQNSELMVSTNGSSWSSSVDVNINGGRGVVQVKSYRQGQSGIIVTAADAESKIIVFESVYSMDGDFTPIESFVNLAKKYKALTYLDEVHGVGLYGSHGGGVAQEQKIMHEIDIINGTLAKAFGLIGGYVSSSKTIIDYIKLYYQNIY